MTGIVISVFQGPNVHARRPLVRLAVDRSALRQMPAEDFRQSLAERLPEDPDWQALRTDLEALAAKDDMVSFADALGRLTRDLQNERLGEPLPVWTEAWRSPDSLDILVGMKDPDVADRAGLLAWRITAVLFSKADRQRLKQERKALMQALARFRQHCAAAGYSNDTKLLIDSARAKGIPARKLVRGQRVALLGHGTRALRIGQNASDRTSAFASLVSNDKAATSRALRWAGIPMPKQHIIESDEDIPRAIDEIGFPMVVKAKTGSKGISVTAAIVDHEAMVAAIAKARRFSRRVIAEEHIEGTDYRLLIIDGRMVAAGRRRPGHVVGDGKSSIATLIAQENERRFARGGYANLLVPLAVDAEAAALLSREGLAADSVPEAGREVRLRSTGNVSQGALPEDVTDEVHPETVATAVRAVRMIGLDIGGVDIMTQDITRPLSETGGAIIEVNHFPGIGVHLATETTPRDVTGAALDYLFPPPEHGRIPIVSVTGTNGKTTTCRMLHRILSEAGHCTGLTTTSGSYVGRERILKGDYANAAGARSVFHDRRVEAAVLETARGGIIKQGLGWDTCNVAVVTNISEDHLGHDGIDNVEQLARVKGTIVELSRDGVVLNADDEHCRGMAERASAPVWWVSSEPPVSMIEEHLANGGNAVHLRGEGEDETIVHQCGEQSTPVLRVPELPCTLGGLVRHNVENALHTTAAALALGIPLETLRRALRGFEPSFEDSPGRLNIRDMDGARIVMDYAHNVDGITRMGDILSTMPFNGRRIFFHAASVRHFAKDIERLAFAAAPYFDCFVVAESLRRGVERPRGEAAGIFREAFIKAGIAPEAIIVEPDEHQAIDIALGLIRPSDLALILPGRHYREVWKKIQALQLGDVIEDGAQNSATRTSRQAS